ncbi:MAG: hypothetical protein KGJ13_07005 [Patescibacteria group bacterium]|nr:hypothetical protein [Patescibacteria group bacterium]
MNHPRRYKRISDTAAISLLAEKEIAGVTTIYRDFLPAECGGDYYEKLVSEGRAVSTVVQFHGVPVYRVIWEILRNLNEMHILLVHQIKNDFADIQVLGTAVDKLAEMEKISAVVMTECRAAMVEQVKNWGAEIIGVKMRKKYAVC